MKDFNNTNAHKYVLRAIDNAEHIIDKLVNELFGLAEEKVAVLEGEK